MHKSGSFFGALATWLTVSAAHAAILTQSFSTDPRQDGWKVFGNTNLFRWDPTNLNLVPPADRAYDRVRAPRP